MAMQRLSLFGFPLSRPQQSGTTVRMVPLTQGMHEGQSAFASPPGSASSLVNFVPLNGSLIPRSRMSQVGTVPPPAGDVNGLTLVYGVDGSDSYLWASVRSSTGSSVYGVLDAAFNFSAASFVSADGLGEPPTASQFAPAQFAQMYLSFDPDLGNNGLLIADGSFNTILAAGVPTSFPGAAPRYSYLTGAPQARFVNVYDNYVIAWNVREAGVRYSNRVRWSSRGDPGVWDPTAPGSNAGFEDLLQMAGEGNGSIAFDNRQILFSTKEIWVGIPASYPAQFQFVPLDTTAGTFTPASIAETELGLIFLGSDQHLRLLPRGGGLSQVFIPDIGAMLRKFAPDLNAWGWYDVERKIYRLMLPFNPFTDQTSPAGSAIIVNLATGEWGLEEYEARLLSGCYAPLGGEHMFAGEFQSGRVYSTNSTLAVERFGPFASPVTSTYRSTPIGQDLPVGRKQLTQLMLAYQAACPSQATVRLSGDFGNNFDMGRRVSLASAPAGNVVPIDTNMDGLGPVVEWQSTSTGYALHRLDATLGLRGRP